MCVAMLCQKALLKFSSFSSSPAHKYYLSMDPVRELLYLSDTSSGKLYRLKTLTEPKDLSRNVEVVAGSGEQCTPFHPNQCGDGGKAIEAALSNPRGENPVHTHAALLNSKRKSEWARQSGYWRREEKNRGMFQWEKWENWKSKINERCLPSLLNQAEQLLVPPIHHCHCLFKPVSQADGQTGAWLKGTYVLLSFKPHCALSLSHSNSLTQLSQLKASTYL